MVRFFVVGMNRCGTLSLHRFLQMNGVDAYHWGGPQRSRNLAWRMRVNLDSGLPVLAGLEHCEAFSDLNFVEGLEYVDISRGLFDALYAEHADDVFILNTRSTSSWLLSRLRHGDFAERAMGALGLGLPELVVEWAGEKEAHEAHVREVLGGRPNFFEYRLGETSDSDLVEFLGQFMSVRRRELPHTHRKLARERRDLISVSIRRQLREVFHRLNRMRQLWFQSPKHGVS